MRDIPETLLICAALLSLCSCEDEALNRFPVGDSDSICFGVSGNVAWPEEATLRSRAEETVIEDMGCYAFINSEQALLINNGRYTRGASGIYTSSLAVYWPGSHTTLDFHNYSPYNAKGLEFDPVSGSPSFSYTIPAKETDRCDLLIASATGVPGDLNNALPLRFRHVLTAVNIDLGKNMGEVEFKKVTFSGLHCCGNVTLDASGNPVWAFPSDSRSDDFDFTIGKTNYLVPQKLEGAMMTIEMIRDGEETDITVPLKTDAIDEWVPGATVNYRLNIIPFFEFDPVEDLDAHYDMSVVNLHVSRLAAGRQWTLSVSSDDNADLTVQHYQDVNSFAKDGFWTDRIMNNGVVSTVSARGTKAITGIGNGDFQLMVFAPQNVGTANRTITLTVTLDNETEATQTITQLCPDWNGDAGWERINDNENAQWGFSYEARHVYVYTQSEEYFTMLRRKRTVDNLIKSYNAESYVSTEEYKIKAGHWRFYVDIDYRKLNNFNDKALSATDGLTNTKELTLLGGTAVTTNFENALIALKRPNESANAVRPSGSDDYQYGVPESIPGSYHPDSQALTLIQKKNRHHLNKFVDDNYETTAPWIIVDEITWYMPAYGQFSPDAFGSLWPHSPSDIWSSTAYPNASQSYTGAGLIESRNNFHHIRACCARP